MALAKKAAPKPPVVLDFSSVAPAAAVDADEEAGAEDAAADEAVVDDPAAATAADEAPGKLNDAVLPAPGNENVDVAGADDELDPKVGVLPAADAADDEDTDKGAPNAAGDRGNRARWFARRLRRNKSVIKPKITIVSDDATFIVLILVSGIIIDFSKKELAVSVRRVSKFFKRY